MRFRSFLRTLLFLLAVAATPAAAQQEATLIVEVKDDTSRIGIPFAQVKINGDGWQSAGVEGTLAWRLPVGQHTLEARAMGYAPRAFRVTLEPGQQGLMQIQLRPSAVLLEQVEVSARRLLRHQEFYARAERAISGEFVTREEIERTLPLRFTDLFRGISSAQILPDVGGNKIRFPSNLPGIMASLQDCAPVYVVDGARYPMPSSPDSEFRVAEIEGIEVYPRGSQAPAQYNFGSTSMCGVIVVWTRA